MGRGVAVVLACGLVAAACTSAPPPPSTDDGLQVVVTTTILGDITRSLVGDAGTVEVLMQPGQDPHEFALSAQQAQSLRRADLVVANGLGLEETLLDALAAAEADATPVVRVAEVVDPLPVPGASDAPAGEPGPEQFDPHVWFDPLRMVAGVEILAEHLARLAPDVDWSARAADLTGAITAAHEQAQRLLRAVPERCRTLITSHDSLRYFAARYDLTIVGTVIPGTSTQSAPSAEDFAALAQLLRDTGLPAIFAESTGSARLATALAGEVGRDVDVVTLYSDSLGEPGSGADTYQGLIVTDARLVADALADC